MEKVKLATGKLLDEVKIGRLTERVKNSTISDWLVMVIITSEREEYIHSVWKAVTYQTGQQQGLSQANILPAVQP